MQAYGFYNHLDLILNEEEFFAKYNISSRVLMLNYNLDYDNLKNICECYVNNKDKIKCWSDIMFPDIYEIIKYFNNDFDFDSLQTKSYINFKENSKFTKLQYDLYRVFKSMGLSIDEIQFVFNKNKAINKFKGVDCLKVVKELRKYGYTKEKIIKLIMSKQYLFNYNINDFVLLIEEISANKNCSTFEAVENYL